MPRYNFYDDRFCRLLGSTILLILFSGHLDGQEQQPIDFARDIQPILSENCYYCHGPDPNKRESGLRLDVEEEAKNVFEAGDAESSELFARISSDDSDELMPPPESNRKVTPKQVELIKQWIEEGGKWAQHWAYAPIVKSEVATDKAIDFFVARKLKQNKLAFSPLADRPTLIRRVSLDLTGLPPTIEQVDEFLADVSTDAYENMVVRFLDSPAYGERMAWNWLDAARYADTNGYQGDAERTMWPWRDWVIKAYNDNLPFDQFSKWQLAGDLLSDATDEQILATGFNRNYPINGEGGRIPEENRVEYVMDMAETTGTIWMGLTFNCCRCHDHKYDQLTQNDYYSLFAFFDQTPIDGSGGDAQTAPVLAVPNPAQHEQKLQLDSSFTELEKTLQTQLDSIIEKQTEWEKAKLESVDSDSDHWTTFKPETHFADAASLKRLEDDSVLAFELNRDTDVYRITGTSSLSSIRGVRLEALSHASMNKGGLSRNQSSNFVLTDFSVSIIGAGEAPRQIKISKVVADYEQQQHPVAGAIDDDPKSGWGVGAKDKVIQQPHEAVFIFEDAAEIPRDAKIRIVLRQESIYKKHNIGRFRISFTEDKQPRLLGLNSALLAVLRTPADARSKAQSELARQSFVAQDTTYQQIRKKIASVKSKLKQLDKSIPKVMVMAERTKPRKSFRLNRGSYAQPLNEVYARVPEMLQAIPDDVKPNRLALANWLFDDSNPLTARVTVNRLWSQFMGIGLVKTTEDLGVQGEPPSHPELLDWLAAEYRDSGWDTKHMVRLILTSRTYRQSSKTNPKLLELDPENRLLARASRLRMPSWMIRDHALASSGRLVTSIGGEPVNSYQPAGVWEESSFGKKKYKLGSGDELYRRSIYTFWRRIAAPTMIFDNADRMTCSVKTYRTNTPLHALNTLNGETFVEASRLLATSVLKLSKTEQESIGLIFKRVVGRSIKQEEESILLAALQRTRRQFLADPESARSLIEIGETQPESQIEAPELASWTSLCLAVLNLDEALTRQ